MQEQTTCRSAGVQVSRCPGRDQLQLPTLGGGRCQRQLIQPQGAAAAADQAPRSSRQSARVAQLAAKQALAAAAATARQAAASTASAAASNAQAAATAVPGATERPAV